jgi:HEAT repeat protein
MEKALPLKAEWNRPAWLAMTVLILCGALAATAQTAAPVVPGRDTPQTEIADGSPAQESKVPSAFPGTSGGHMPTKGKVLWKGAAPDWEARALLFRMRDSDEAEARARALEMLPLDETKASDLERLFAAAQAPQPSMQQAAWSSLDRCAEKDLFAYAIRTLAWGTEDRVRPLDAALPKLGPRLEKMMTATLETELEAPRHRRAAAYCLGRSGAAAAAPLLAKYARAGQGDLAETCAVALSMLRSPGALRDWEEMLTHEDTTIRIIAVRALADLDTAPARRVLFETAAGKREAGRPAEQEAARMIGQLPDADSIPALIEIMRTNTPLNALAAKLLHEKTGQNFGTSPEPWESWLRQGGQKRGAAGQAEVVQQQPE